MVLNTTWLSELYNQIIFHIFFNKLQQLYFYLHELFLQKFLSTDTNYIIREKF